MRRRIDLGGDGSQDDLEEALRQLQRPRKPTAEQPAAEVEEAVRELAEQQKVAAAAKKPRPRRPAWLTWGAVALVAVGAIGALFAFTRPEPPPPPAASAREAVSGFWRAMIAGKYEAAAFYCPAMVDKYGSRKQAGERLKEQFGSNPPVRLAKIGEPEELPDSSDVRVSYELYLRSGTPRAGDAIVTYSGNPQVGYVIVAGL
jgi:hypothetical protein